MHGVRLLNVLPSNKLDFIDFSLTVIADGS